MGWMITSDRDVLPIALLIIGAMVIIACNIRELRELVKKNRELDEIIKALKEGRDVGDNL